ncbi:MAG: type III secretion system chaperone [Candidatus Competibacteraceae bacterium]
MSESQNLDELMVEAAELAELDEVIRVQEDRTAWLLGINDQDTVLAEWQEATRRMLFMLEIGPLPEQPDAGCGKCCITTCCGNRPAGARIGLLPPENRLQLLLDVHAEQLGATQVVTVLDNMMQVAQAWRETLNPDAEGAVDEDTPPSPSDNPNLFIRV